MNTKLKRLITGIIISTACFASFSEAYAADKFRIKFYNIEAYDDGDNDPDGEGEITFSFALNGDPIFKKYMELDDKTEAKNKTINISKIITVPDGHNVSVTSRGHEKDSWIGSDETCRGSLTFNRHSTGEKRLDCGESNGDLGIWLDFNVQKLN